MPIIRLIYCRFPAAECETASATVTHRPSGRTLKYVDLLERAATIPAPELAVQNWKDYCAPLMIQQPGCMSEKLLRCTDDPGEFISYSEWETQSHIDAYLKSADHQEIKRVNEKLGGVQVVVKTYERV